MGHHTSCSVRQCVFITITVTWHLIVCEIDTKWVVIVSRISTDVHLTQTILTNQIPAFACDSDRVKDPLRGKTSALNNKMCYM